PLPEPEVVHVRIIDDFGRIVHERSFIVDTPRKIRSNVKLDSVKIIPSEDGTAAVLKPVNTTALFQSKGCRLHFRFQREQQGLPTYKQWGTKDDEQATLEFPH